MTDEFAGDDVAARVWQALRLLVLERNDHRREVCQALDMSFIRAKALRRLAIGELTLRGLADDLAIDAAYATVIVDDLEQRGYVRRSPHPGDRRAKLVAVTVSGLSAAQQAEQILAEPPVSVRALDAADLAALDRIAAILLHGTDAVEPV